MEELKQKIIDLCNESKLPLEALLFITRDVYRDVEDSLRNFTLANAKQEEEKQDE